MKKNGHCVSSIYDDIPQKHRDRAFKEFKEGRTRILISTFTRGSIDIYQVSIVINYDLLLNKETYIHRISGSSRVDRNGTAITFIPKGEKEQFDLIKKICNTKIEILPTDLWEIK